MAVPLVCNRPSAAVPQVVPHARTCLLLAASRFHIWPCLVAAAFSAPLASSMLAVPLARPSIAPPTGNAPPSSCASTPTDSAASTSVFTAVLASPRGSGSSWSSLRARLPGAGPHGGRRPHNGNASGSIHQPYYLLRCMRPNIPKITQTFRAGLRQRPPGRIRHRATRQQSPL